MNDEILADEYVHAVFDGKMEEGDRVTFAYHSLSHSAVVDREADIVGLRLSPDGVIWTIMAETEDGVRYILEDDGEVKTVDEYNLGDVRLGRRDEQQITRRRGWLTEIEIQRDGDNQ